MGGESQETHLSHPTSEPQQLRALRAVSSCGVGLVVSYACAHSPACTLTLCTPKTTRQRAVANNRENSETLISPHARCLIYA